MPEDNQERPAPVSSRVLDLGSLFAAPLVSVIRADVLAAREFTKFLTSFGFEDDGTSADGKHLGALRTVTFSYKRPAADGTLQDAIVEIPVLSLVPLPLLQVTDAEFNFNVHVLESDNTALGEAPPLLRAPEPESAERGNGSGSAAATQPPVVRAMLAPAPTKGERDGTQRSLDANMVVKLAMKQADVPAGISTLLQLMNQAVNSSPPPKETQ
jgi:hypothetical protein